MSALISIVVIDDEPAIRNGLTTIISESLEPGYHVVGQASDGFEGLEMVCRLKPDIVISDIIMPGLTGLELIGEVRKSNSRTRFIILSGYDDFSYAKEAIRLKASDYLLKPVPRAELVKAIREAAASLETGEETTREIEELQKSATILFLQRLIKGEIRNRTELNSGLTSLSIHLIDSRTTIIAMHFPDSDEVANAESVVADFAKKNKLVSVKDQLNQVIITNSDSDGALYMAKQLSSLMMKHRFSFIIGTGSTEVSLLDAVTSYKKALVALSYRMYDSNRIIFTQQDIKDIAPAFAPRDIDTASLMEILTGNESDKEVEIWCDSLFQKILFVETPPPSFTRGLLIYLIADINRQLGKMLDIDSRILETPDFSIVGEILSVESLRSRTQKYLLKLKNTVIPQSRLQNDPIILSTIRYVDSNISKAGISASEIAGKLNLSDTYFSTIFKAKTGETFRSYVLKRKNEYAKKLLADRSLSMDDIACNLGYTDYRSFHRLFKQLNGISPTEYRKGLSQ